MSPSLVGESEARRRERKLAESHFVRRPYRWSHRPGVGCRSFHRRGWHQSRLVAQSSPAPGVWPVASACRDTSSPGSGSAGTVGTGRGGTAAGTGELRSSASWLEQSEREAGDGNGQTETKRRVDVLSEVRLTSRIVFDRWNVPNHQIRLYPCRTGLPEWWRHSSTLKTDRRHFQWADFFKTRQTCVGQNIVWSGQRATHPAEPAAGRVDMPHCGTSGCSCVQHSWGRHHTPRCTGAPRPGHSASVDCKDRVPSIPRCPKPREREALGNTSRHNVQRYADREARRGVEWSGPGLPTDTGSCYEGRTLWTRSRVT